MRARTESLCLELKVHNAESVLGGSETSSDEITRIITVIVDLLWSAGLEGDREHSPRAWRSSITLRSVAPGAVPAAQLGVTAPVGLSTPPFQMIL